MKFKLEEVHLIHMILLHTIRLRSPIIQYQCSREQFSMFGIPLDNELTVNCLVENLYDTRVLIPAAIVLFS